jgi:glutamate/tyrosine decarboxylase-like PLP-dependent enzyme
MRDILESAAQRAIAYLETRDARAVAPTPAAVAGLSVLDIPLPAAGLSPDEVLRTLDEVGSPATMAMTGGRFFGFVIGGALPVSVGANWLATAWDQNSAMKKITPATARFEAVALEWLLDLFRLPPTAGAGFVTGATMANLTALAAARHALLEREGWDVEARGLFGAPPIAVIVGEEAHSTLFKALGILGMGRDRVIRVPADAQGRLRADLIPPIAGSTIICAQAGNMHSGDFDPFPAICARAREAGAWVHVDGAFGLWAAAVPALAHLTAGLDEADSWAIDFHKWLNVPYDSGIAIVRDAAALRGAMSIAAPYLLMGGAERNPSDYTPELSRRARGVEVWAALRALGREGIAEVVEQGCRHARRFGEGLRAAGYDVLNEIVLNQVVVIFKDETTTDRVIQAIQADGTCWCGGTTWQGKRAMRISVSSAATTDEDVELSLAAMIRCAREVAAVR